MRASDRIVVRDGEMLRGAEQLDIVGVLEADVRSAIVDRSQPMA